LRWSLNPICQALLLVEVTLRQAWRAWLLRLLHWWIFISPAGKVRGVATARSVHAAIVIVRAGTILIGASLAAVLIIIVATRAAILRARVGAKKENRGCHRD